MPRHYTRHKTDDAPTTHHKASNSGETAVLEDRRKNPYSMPVSDKVQAFDATKGWDLTKYDMRRGEIGNPAVPFPHEPKVAPLPSHQSTGLCVECGKPTAPGQTYVCRDHVRFN